MEYLSPPLTKRTPLDKRLLEQTLFERAAAYPISPEEPS
jgi:hypothetical protein